jgi:D-alanyl-D-alanine carboxypeptidase (penicillin-binding protein 5/6)
LVGSRPGSLPLYPGQIASYQAGQQVPPLTAPAALLADGDTEQALMALAPDQSRAMASTTKIMTALLTLEHGGLEQQVVVSPDALVGESSMGLVAGEVLTVEDLLWGLLLNSGNDAAVALAEHVGGSEAAFVDMMNARAAELGLEHTHFANPHGLDAPEHYSSPADLWHLAQAALAFPLFREMVATLSYTAAGHPLWNRNELLTLYPDADGVKTGTSDLAGECLVASVTRDGHRVIAVVLGSTDRYADATALLDKYFAAYRWAPAPQPAGLTAWIRVADGTPYRVTAPEAPDLFLSAWQWTQVRAQALLQPTSAEGGLPQGTVRWYLGDLLLAEAPAVLSPY